MRLDRKTAIVIGGGRGLGRSISFAFAREGANVVVAARTKSEIDHVASEIEKMGRHALAVRTDAIDYEQVKALVQETVDRFGAIDVLVNCQGESLIKPTVETSMGEYNLILDSNLKSVFQTCQAVLPKMLEQKNGHIINVASRVGVYGAANVAAYAAAKAGLIGFSKALAIEMKPKNIKVNVLCPAPMDTPMRWKATPQFDRAKVIKPEIVAEFAVLLASMGDSLVQDTIIPASTNY